MARTRALPFAIIATLLALASPVRACDCEHRYHEGLVLNGRINTADFTGGVGGDVDYGGGYGGGGAYVSAGASAGAMSFASAFAFAHASASAHAHGMGHGQGMGHGGGYGHH